MLPLSKSFLQHNVSNTCINSTWWIPFKVENRTTQWFCHSATLPWRSCASLELPLDLPKSGIQIQMVSLCFTRNGTAKLGTSKPARLSKSALISCWLRCLTSPSSTTARMTSFCKIGMWSSLRAGSKRHRFLWDAMILWISWPECCPALARKINKRNRIIIMDELRRLALRLVVELFECTSNGPIRIGGTWPTWTTWDEVLHLRRTGLQRPISERIMCTCLNSHPKRWAYVPYVSFFSVTWCSNLNSYSGRSKGLHAHDPLVAWVVSRISWRYLTGPWDTEFIELLGPSSFYFKKFIKFEGVTACVSRSSKVKRRLAGGRNPNVWPSELCLLGGLFHV